MAMMDWTEIDACLAQDIESQGTEILLPVRMEVAPVWSHEHNRAGFYARLSVQFAGDHIVLDELECDHIHGSYEEAWPCAQTLARQLAQTILEGQAWR